MTKDRIYKAGTLDGALEDALNKASGKSITAHAAGPWAFPCAKCNGELAKATAAVFTHDDLAHSHAHLTADLAALRAQRDELMQERNDARQEALSANIRAGSLLKQRDELAWALRVARSHMSKGTPPFDLIAAIDAALAKVTP